MGGFGQWKERLYTRLRRTLYLENMDLKLSKENQLSIDAYLQANLYNHPRYQESGKLNRFEFQAFSQFGEDGIVEEIFRRIGVTNRYFVEFGVETGVETNTTYLLHQEGWQGLWLDGSEAHVQAIRQQFGGLISQGRLKAMQRFIMAENIQEIFREAGVPEELDLLSIDIDRNDYHVWKAISDYRPRVVIIEYNAVFRPGTRFVVPYDGAAMWDGSSCTGASLEALCRLGDEKGYALVACSFAGVNAFFVKKDLAEKYFTGPFTAQHHYEPPRYFLYTVPGHPRRVSL